MDPSLWRSAELPLLDGVIAVDVEGSGSRTRYFVAHETSQGRRELNSVPQLADALKCSGVEVERLAASEPVGLGFTVSVLAGRPYSILYPERLQWARLERHFGLDPAANEPRVEDGCLRFLVCAHYSPTLEIRRYSIDLHTWEIVDEVLIQAPWPPAAVAAGR